jgi:DNA polymerase/3'-5' exonuclease PolX
MIYKDAIKIAEAVKEQLIPHCERIEIAGSIRRKKLDVKDIEIVAIPKPYEIGLFESGIATVINRWEKVKGELPCKYTQRILPEGIKLDLFFAEPRNWGLILAIRTGSADYSHKVLATGWVSAGYKSVNGVLTTLTDQKIVVAEEIDLFKLIGVPYTEPKYREISNNT